MKSQLTSLEKIQHMHFYVELLEGAADAQRAGT